MTTKACSCAESAQSAQLRTHDDLFVPTYLGISQLKNIQLFLVGWASCPSYELGGQDAQRQSPTEGKPTTCALAPPQYWIIYLLEFPYMSILLISQ